MAEVYDNFEQARTNKEASKIVAELVSMGGIHWAICTISQIPDFADQRQEELRLALKNKLASLSSRVL